MKSSLPKVLHPLGSRSLVERVLNVSESLHPRRKLVIIGYQGQQVRNTLQHLEDIEFVEQKEQLGTGQCYSAVNPPFRGLSGDLLVLNGDVPLLRPETLQNSSPDS
jgi:bifunctional UDP-N-acetylglucosamine pyrophosphorylase/glucosamine-1-phosphate N-acetyltransferase